MADRQNSGLKLSKEDVQSLIENPTEDNKISTATKVASQFTAQGFSAEENQIAADIFRLMLADVEVKVRKTLAVNLVDAKALPGDIAKKIATDEDNDIAVPFIQNSQALTAEDLISIIRTDDENKQIAVATRPTVDVKVSEVLINEGRENAVVALVSNEGAEIKDEGFTKVLDRFGENNQKFHAPLISRKKIPMDVAVRLVDKVSDQLRTYLMTHHELPPDVVTNLVLQTREKTTIGLSHGAEDDQVHNLIDELKANKRLTPSILIRSLFMGETAFFEHAMAALTSVPIHNVRMLIYDAGGLGLKGLYDKAGMPDALYPAFRAAIDVIQETQLDGLDNDKERFSRRVMERIMTQMDSESGIDLAGGDIDYLLGKMGQLPGNYNQTAAE